MAKYPRSQRAEFYGEKKTMRLLAVFSATLGLGGFLSAMLVPIAGKLLLPRFGGSQQIWVCCVLLVNLAAFMGYLYAHIVGRLAPKPQLIVHGLLVMLGAVCLLSGPFDVASWPLPAEGSPLSTLVLVFAVLFALPFLLVAATASLLQCWFSRIAHPAAEDPYFLYGATVLGECGGIIAYAWWIEPNLRLSEQAWRWTAGYGLLALMMAACAACMLLYPRRALGVPVDESQFDGSWQGIVIRAASLRKPTLVTRLLWIGAPAAETPLRLAFVWVSGPIDISPYPFVAVISSILPLLAIALAFSRWPISGTGFPFGLAVILWPVLLAACAVSTSPPAGGVIVLNLAAFFVTGLICYGSLATTRPRIEYLTEFYLLISVGRLLGLPWLFVNNGG